MLIITSYTTSHAVLISIKQNQVVFVNDFLVNLIFFFRHDDPDPTRNNTENECYCLQDEGFKCLPSGAMYMEPCKRADMAPVALSMPHFYQADPIYRERVGGMTPDKEKHQFYMDVVPQFGFPLAIRPRFQLNVVISGEQHIS